jgi:glycosyltransferase involved in cell wall biosynthesis
MKIGAIYTLYGRRAGVELYTERVIAGLLSTGPDLSFTVFCNREAARALPSHPRLRLQPVRALENQYAKAFWLECRSAAAVRAAGVDAMWIPSGTNHFPGRWTIPTVVTFHDLAEYRVRGRYALPRMLYRKWICVPRSVRRAARLTAVSETTAADLRTIAPGADPVVIRSGPSPRAYRGPIPDAAERVRRETGRSLASIIFFCGRTDYVGKGLDVLIEAYHRLVGEAPDAPPLVMAGPKGEGHPRLEQDIRRRGLADRVLYLGRVSDECLDALYQVSEMVVLPSRYEGFGFPALEAMERGVPVICARAGALPEIAGPGARLVEAGSADELGRAMRNLHARAEEREQAAARGREWVRQFSWEAAGRRMIEVFREAAGAG